MKQLSLLSPKLPLLVNSSEFSTRGGFPIRSFTADFRSRMAGLLEFLKLLRW